MAACNRQRLAVNRPADLSLKGRCQRSHRCVNGTLYASASIKTDFDLEKILRIILNGKNAMEREALVVDDDEMILHLLESMLANTNYNTVRASNGDLAVDLLGEGHFDLLSCI